MINQNELKEIIDQIIICETIRNMFKEQGKRRSQYIYEGKADGLFIAMEKLGYKRSTAEGMVLMEREKRIQRKKEMEESQKEKEETE